MRPVSVTQAGVGTSAIIVHDYLPVPTNISLSTVCTSFPVNYDIEHTFDDVFASTYNPATGNWFKSQLPGFIGATQGLYNVVNFPVRASRINNRGVGTVVLTAIQGTSSN